MNHFSKVVFSSARARGPNRLVTGRSHRLDLPVSHLTPEEVEEFRQSLITRRRKLVRDIGQLQNEASYMAGLGGTGGSSPKAGDGAAVRGGPWERVLRLSSIAHKRSLLHEVEQALERIEKRTYGLCTESNEAISISRLREIPWARNT